MYNRLSIYIPILGIPSAYYLWLMHIMFLRTSQSCFSACKPWEVGNGPGDWTTNIMYRSWSLYMFKLCRNLVMKLPCWVGIALVAWLWGAVVLKWVLDVVYVGQTAWWRDEKWVNCTTTNIMYMCMLVFVLSPLVPAYIYHLPTLCSPFMLSLPYIYIMLSKMFQFTPLPPTSTLKELAVVFQLDRNVYHTHRYQCRSTLAWIMKSWFLSKLITLRGGGSS